MPPAICLPSDKDVAQRKSTVQGLLKPLSKSKHGPAFKIVPNTTQIAIGATEGTAGQDFRSWRFPACIDNFSINYFELWKQDKSDVWFLDRAYLNIYKKIHDNEKEYLCLHCDPDEPKAAAHSKYKRGPHIHVSLVDEIKHAHIGLYVGYLDNVLKSAADLTEAMSKAIHMIKDELFPAFRT